jgi:hypothetical protein
MLLNGIRIYKHPALSKATMAPTMRSNDHSICNDIAIGRGGSAHLTDTASAQILRLPWA